jgi:predicted Zn-dependent protease with MMP-like domain
VEEAFDALPEELLGFVDNVVFLVEDWPDRETLASLSIVGRDGLRDSHLTGALPDRVVLFQRPIERHARQMGLPVVDVIRDTLLHEVGHHFGLSEVELARLEGEG